VGAGAWQARGALLTKDERRIFSWINLGRQMDALSSASRGKNKRGAWAPLFRWNIQWL